MKRVVLILCLLGCAITIFARHSKGGYLVYEYEGAGSAANTSRYKITVLHYVNCEELQFELGSVYVGIYDAASKAYVSTLNITRTSEQTIQKRQFDGCINPIPEVCFFLAFYVAEIELPNNQSGYVLAEQECCRAEGIGNLLNSGELGTTNFNTIPGVINGIDFHKNSSAVFVIKDTAVICHNSPFELDFGATDPDGDVLTYSFCNATAGGTRDNRQPNPPPPPPYPSVDYAVPYSGVLPLGTNVGIDRKTGLIKGKAPDKTGTYTIAVCITETRNGVDIATTKKEILITVADCTLSAAGLAPVYINCNNYSFTFQNESYASNVSSYLWDFGAPPSDSSLLTQPTPAFTYKDTGTYKLKLKVTSGTNCSDSATSEVKVYPGFSAGFSTIGSCFQSPFLFNDSSYAKYGIINQYKWDFGDVSTGADTSNNKNASYQYTKAGNVTATLIIASDKGCRDTATKTIAVNNKPQIILPFADTLICKDDRLAIPVQTSGTVYSWLPVYNISNATIINPVVYPFDTTVYTLTVHDKQCVDSIKLTVNVIDSVTVQLPQNLSLCATDTLQLQPKSVALYYSWQEAGTAHSLDNYHIKTPTALPLQSTAYSVTASVGHCVATTQTTVLVSPYPSATVSEKESICFGNTAQLQATTTAANYSWSPASSLLGANTLHPLAGPQETTAYVLSISDTLNCKKTVKDTVLVQVIPPYKVNAGNDTSAVLNQPLQLHAATPVEASFTWSPSTGMYTNAVSDPVVIITDPTIHSLAYAVTTKTQEGCTATDSIYIHVYTSKPDIFLPSAFTPDNDGRNDIFRPIITGVAQFSFFRVYNRLGERIYETTKAGEGWDGYFNGKLQPPGTYVYEARGTDYTGKPIVKRGTVVLIR